MGEIVRLRRPDLPTVHAFLAQSPMENVLMLDLLETEGLPGPAYREFVGYREAGEWLAVACFSGDISLFATDAGAVRAIAEYALRRVPFVPRVIARAETVGAFWETFSRAPNPVVFDRGQWVYVLEAADLVLPPGASARPAAPAEAAAVSRLASAMSFEEIGIAPLDEHPRAYARLVAERVRAGRYFVLAEGGAIRFQMHLSALTPLGGQITGVYTVPTDRGKGYARRGLAAACRLAFALTPRLSLFVNDFNTPAIRLYESLGFKRAMPYRAIFLAPEPMLHS